MRFSFVVIALSTASAVSAATLFARQSFPECSLPCVLEPASLFGCSADDNLCLCRSEQYVAQTTLCIQNACGPEDTETAESLSRQLCAAVGVTLTATPTPSASGSGSQTSASATSTSGSSSPSATAPGSSTGSTSATGSAPAASNTSNAAASSGANALFGLAAIALAAINL